MEKENPFAAKYKAKNAALHKKLTEGGMKGRAMKHVHNLESLRTHKTKDRF